MKNKLKARWGLDYVRGSNSEPMYKTKSGWKRFVNTKISSQLKQIGFKPFVGLFNLLDENRDYYTISVGKQTKKVGSV